MFTSENFPYAGSKAQDVADLANALLECPEPIRSCDPFEVWQKHPVVSQFLYLRDRFIAQAIDAATKS